MIPFTGRFARGILQPGSGLTLRQGVPKMHISRKGTIAALCSAATASMWPRNVGAEGPRFTLRFSVPPVATSVLGIVALRFAQRVKQRTNGELQIDVYP